MLAQAIRRSSTSVRVTRAASSALAKVVKTISISVTTWHPPVVRRGTECSIGLVRLLLFRGPRRWRRPGALALLLLAAGGVAAATSPTPRLPAIVFVSRNPIPGMSGAVPGLGPHQRAAITGGRLLVRETDGSLRELLPAGRFFDVSDPSVSPDGRTIAFAGVEHRDDPWRIWEVGLDGSGLEQVTPEAAAAGTRADDLDPAWIDATTLVFASTRYPERAQYADVPVTNLFEIRTPDDPRPGRAPVRITSERNGAEEPVMDWRTGRIVFARWWFNRWRAGAGGLTDDEARAIPRDTINLWQPMELSPADRRPRLAAADFRTRRSSM